MEILKLDTSEESRSLIAEFLANNEYLLPDKLSDHVNICQYSEKLNRLGSSFVCVIDGIICGIVTGYINDIIHRQAHLQVLIVRKESQGLGIGHLLVRAFLLTSKELGMEEVILTCDRINTHAKSFYLREGFKESKQLHPNPLKQFLVYSIDSN